MNILFLTDQSRFEGKMSLMRRRCVEAVSRLPDVKLQVWGPAYAGWLGNRTLAQNLSHHPDGPFQPDVIWCYRPGLIHGLEDVPAVRAVSLNEANDKAWGRRHFLNHARPHVLTFSHENDLPRWADLQLQGVQLVHIPRGADPTDFPNGDNQDRPIDVLLTGNTDPKLYPLRARWKRLIEDGRIPGAVVREHPGYHVSSPEASSLQYADYCSQLQQAKILLTCSSKHRYPLSKHVEGPMAGCLVITDPPNDSAWESSLWPYAIAVSPNAADDQLVNSVQHVLSNWEHFAQQAQAGRRAALEQCTTDIWAERFMEAIYATDKIQARPQGHQSGQDEATQHDSQGIHAAGPDTTGSTP